MMRYHKYFYRNTRMRNRMSIVDTLNENNDDKTVILITFSVDKRCYQRKWHVVHNQSKTLIPCTIGFKDII